MFLFKEGLWVFPGLLMDAGAGGEGQKDLSKYPTYPTIMKLGTVIPYLKKVQNIYESRDILLEFC